MGDQKTYFVVMQDNFNALYRRHVVTISPLFIHIKKLKRYLELKQNKKVIECNVFLFCFKFPERCGYFELKRNKCDVSIYGWFNVFSKKVTLHY